MEKDLHRLIRRELRDLGIYPPLDVEELCRALSKRRGRPLVLRSAPLERPGPSGLWVEFDDYDVILYQEETTRLHQEHIVLHEVGHIFLAEHAELREQASAEQEDDSDAFVSGWADMLPMFDPDLIKRVARRCSYDDGEECSVELVATIILEWSSVLEGATSMSEDPSLRRIESAFGDRRGWL
ncbi:hypothetical protein ABT112_02170 [Streptomyces sp. NPDC002055]|uniref:hypothetical protein n=1 Tax=Streptomyces sp. NPDC002055 TaxID=3154534 RepID=UPI003320498D